MNDCDFVDALANAPVSLFVMNLRNDRFEDHQLWHPDCNTNNIYITSQQDLIISYCGNNPRQQKGPFTRVLD